MAAAATKVVDIDATDAHLVTKAQDGDRAAFEELYRRHAHPAWRLALAVLGSREAAETAVATGFTSSFRKLRSGTASVATPFRLLVVRATFDAASEGIRHASPDAAPNAVVAAFRKLPERWRGALWLTMVEGGTPAQVGPLLGISEDTAASLSRKASKGLHERRLQSPTTAAAADDPRDELRALVIGLPAGLRSATVECWSSWRDESRPIRVGFATLLPARLNERVVGVAAAAVLALGLIGVLGSRVSNDPTKAPLLAAPAAAAPAPAATATTATAKPATPVKLSLSPATAPRAGHAGSAKSTSASKPKAASGDVARASSAPAASAASPEAASPAPGGAAPAPAPSDPTPAATADPGPGVAAGTTVGDQPVTAGATGDGDAGVQVGPVIIGTPPPADDPGVTIDSGLIPDISLGL
jgi:DNA-directed RNA polymerase specialized sigma24 family protein